MNCLTNIGEKVTFKDKFKDIPLQENVIMLHRKYFAEFMQGIEYIKGRSRRTDEALLVKRY